jgi:hypothetical protein
MSTDNGVSLSTIHELMVGHGRDLGRLEGHMLRVDSRLDGVETDMNSIRCAWQQQGLKLASIETSCANHARESCKRDEKISALFRAVNTVEDTGVIHVAALEKQQAIEAAKWRVLKYLGAGLVATIGIAQAIFVLLKGV